MGREEIDLSVIIPTASHADLLPMVVGHLEIQTYPAARFEVVIVDTGITGRTPELLERFGMGAPVRIRCLHEPTGNSTAALNRALREAEGRWVLFLDDDLLAGPELVEAHVKAQQRFENGCAVAGWLGPHPQVDLRLPARAYRLVAERRWIPGQPLRFLDWQSHNLSLPRALALEAGGFDEHLPHGAMEDIELAWRLERAGLKGVFSEEARAHTWLPADLNEESRRHYLAGYGLHHLIELTESRLLSQRYRSLVRGWRVAPRAMVALISPLCPILARTSRLCAALQRSLLRHSFHRGYQDAQKGRSPRYEEGMAETRAPENAN